MENKPWLPYLATEYIRQLNPKNIFEWGSGGSSMFFIKEIFRWQLGANRLITIEHDFDWHNKIKAEFDAQEITHYDYILIPPDPGEIGPDSANPLHYKSGSTNLGDVNFKRYASIIDDYGLFDLILIDGMARASCIQHAYSHVAPGGCMVIDNTNDRPYYLEQTGALFGNYESGWERVDIMGYGPILAYKWQTTFLFNRAKDSYEPSQTHQAGS